LFGFAMAVHGPGALLIRFIMIDAPAILTILSDQEYFAAFVRLR
jgi:hypothetical protein